MKPREADIGDGGQHTFVATLRAGSQKAGEGWFHLPFKPLNRPVADQAGFLPRVMGHWSEYLLEGSHNVEGVVLCG